MTSNKGTRPQLPKITIDLFVKILRYKLLETLHFLPKVDLEKAVDQFFIFF